MVCQPAVCMRVAFHENDGNHENDEDNSHSYKQGAECWISENHATTQKTETTGIWGTNHEFPKTTSLEIESNSRKKHDCQRRDRSFGSFLRLGIFPPGFGTLPY